MKDGKIWYGPASYADAPQEMQAAISVRGLGLREVMAPGLVHRPGGTPDYLLMHFNDSVEILVDGRRQAWPAHSFIIWVPNCEHFYGTRSGEWRHSWVHMTGAEAASILAVSIIPLNVPMVLRNSNIIERFVGALFDELSLRDTPEAVVLQCLLTLWMFELRRENEDHSHATTNKQRLIAARRYIEEHISDSISLRQLADVAGLSVGHFSSEFKALFGASPIDYVLNLRLQHAAYQLQNLQMSIGQIATRTGFSDAFYFSKQFKRRYGVTPSEYRRR